MSDPEEGSPTGVGSDDEEEIDNFLADVIGDEVGTDVLGEFSNPDSFAAELFEVVTSSFNPPSNLSSRQNSSQEPDILNTSSTNENAEGSGTKLAGRSTTKFPKPKYEKKWKELITDETESSTSKPSQTGQTIQSRLKIRLKNPPAVVERVVEKRKSKPLPKLPKASQSTSKVNPTLAVRTSDNANLTLHRKCIRRQNHESKQLGILPCCVIVYDILEMKSFLQMMSAYSMEKALETTHSGCSVTLGTFSNKQLNTFSKLEDKRRLAYTNILNPTNKQEAKSSSKSDVSDAESINEGKGSKAIKPKNTKDIPKETKPPSSTENSSKKLVVAEVPKKSSTKLSESLVPKAVEEENLPKSKVHDDGRKKKIVGSPDSPKKKKEDTDEDTRRRKVSVKEDSRHSKSADKKTVRERDDRDRHVERGRGNDNRSIRKFEQLECERKRKFADTSKGQGRSKNDSSFRPEQAYSPSGKAFTNSFRIPKRHSGTHEVQSMKPELSTPLAKEDIPSENLKFDRPKTGKEDKDNKHSYTKKPSWTPKSKNDRSEAEPFHFKNESEEVTAIKAEDEDQTTGHGHEEYGSDGGRSGVDTLPPLSQVQIGDLAVAVTGLLQNKSDKDHTADLTEPIPSFEPSSDSFDSTAEKCAWWFKKSEKEPPYEECNLTVLESVPSSYASDNESDISFVGNVSNPGTLESDCQVHEISSTSYASGAGATARDADRVDEFCGRSLLQAKIRSSTGQNFRNIFDLRSGALYEKENFQAKCNLCNQLIIGKRDLAQHVRGAIHKSNLRKLDSKMETSGDNAAKKPLDNDNTNSGKTNKTQENKIKQEPKETQPESFFEDQNKAPKPARSESVDVKVKEEPVEKHVKKEPVEQEMETGRTSSGLRIKVPVAAGSSRRHSPRSPVGRKRSTSRSRNRSRSREKRRRSRSPIRRIPRSPEHPRQSRRSRSRSLDHKRHSRRSRSPRVSRKRRSSSEEVKKFLARTNKRSNSPMNGHYSKSKRGRRSRSRTKSPQLAIKKDNKEFNEKLALTAEGKWTDEMEKQWKLMEAEDAMFREQFYDRRKAYISTPEEHPKYAVEWTEFWERRYQEVEKEGKDPDSYDYVTEWKEYWSKRLNRLLQEEADEKIKSIKEKYKMDYDSLSQLRKLGSSPIIKSELHPQPPQMFKTNNGSNEQLVMAMAPDGRSSNGTILDVASGRSVSSFDESVRPGTNMKRPEPDRKPSISVEDFKSTWEALTRPKAEEELIAGSLTDGLKIAPNKSFQSLESKFISVPMGIHNSQRRISANKSEITTSSDGSYDFDGFDLVQVLRLMCQCEDQLSFLAPRVLEYFKLAEDMELKKSRGSHALLNNEELVSVLFQSRDRFMTMIRSNVLSREILKSLNLTVYALNAILDAPQCQRFRPKLPITLPELETLEVKPKAEPVAVAAAIPEPPIQNQFIPREPSHNIDHKDEFFLLCATVSLDKKKLIASEITKYLISVGGEGIVDSKLNELVRKLFLPLAKQIKVPQDSKPNVPIQEGRNLNTKPHQFESVATILSHDYAHSNDMRISSVSSSKVVGSALPALPHMTYRAAPTEQKDISDPTRERRGNSSSTTDGIRSRSGGRDNSDGSGRRSPFSRREFSGNPIASNPGRL